MLQAVDVIYDKNSGNNLCGDDCPYIHFEEVDADQPLVIESMLKGGQMTSDIYICDWGPYHHGRGQ